MRISVHHRLTVDLGTGHAHCVQQVLLTPRSAATQTVGAWTVSMTGMDTAARFEDAYGNIAHLVSQTRAEGALAITVEGVVETFDRHGVLGRSPGEPVPALFKRFTALTEPDPTLYEPLQNRGLGRIAILHELMGRLAGSAGKDRAETETEAQSQSQTQSQMQADGQPQEQSQGEDDDATEPSPDAVGLAHRFIGAARALDIPARYVTGYLLTGRESMTFHAWAEAYDTALGWIGFDPSLDLCPTDRHVRLAVGLDADAALPVRCFPDGGPLTVLGLEVALAGGVAPQ